MKVYKGPKLFTRGAKGSMERAWGSACFTCMSAADIHIYIFRTKKSDSGESNSTPYGPILLKWRVLGQYNSGPRKNNILLHTRSLEPAS